MQFTNQIRVCYGEIHREFDSIRDNLRRILSDAHKRNENRKATRPQEKVVEKAIGKVTKFEKSLISELKAVI